MRKISYSQVEEEFQLILFGWKILQLEDKRSLSKKNVLPFSKILLVFSINPKNVFVDYDFQCIKYWKIRKIFSRKYFIQSQTSLHVKGNANEFP